MSFAIVLSGLAISGAASAQEAAPSNAPAPSASPPPPQEATPVATKSFHSEERWYGWQTLAVDGGAIALTGIGVATGSNPLVYGGYATFLLGAPVVHFTHGGDSIGKGFGSFVLRLLVPPVTTGIGALAGLIAGGSGKSDTASTVFGAANGAAYGALTGLFVGYAVCIGIDGAALAREKVKVEDPEAGAHARLEPKPWFTVSPTAAIGPSQGTVGVAGTF